MSRPRGVYATGMKRIVHWIARVTEDLGGIDDRFSSFEGRHVFDSGWVGGKVIVSAEEAAAIRQSLYLMHVLTWAATAPLVTINVIFIWSFTWGTPGVAPSFFTAAFPIVLVVIAVLSLIPYHYMAMAIRGKPRFDEH